MRDNVSNFYTLSRLKFLFYVAFRALSLYTGAMGRIPCAFSCDSAFLEIVDRRARSLGMKRSQYIVQVLRQDLLTGQPNLSIVAEAGPTWTTKKKGAKP